ncbi:MAG: 2-oxoglutarate dehydrogenase E1 component [Armatimonadota bacterium]
MTFWGDVSGLNAGYVVELYERYRRNPEAVDATTRAFFECWRPPVDGAATPPTVAIDKIVGAANLAATIRRQGHLEARLDPLGGSPPGDPWLAPAAWGLTDDDLRHLPAGLVGGPLAARASNALEAVGALRAVYSATTGYDCDHVQVAEERDWLRDAVEAGRYRAPVELLDPAALLDRLTQVDVFERFLHRIFPGKTRFSIEGLDMMVPMLDEVIGAAAEAGIRAVFLGMAHRGRLNVLAHILNKSYAQILAEFRDPVRSRTFREDLGWTGDVKYHKGARTALGDDEGTPLVVTMVPNPSHLEAVNPVVEGMARAAETRVDRPGPPRIDPGAALPILIHGDAAFPGQGVVAETLNFSRLRGYQTGGTIHVIANNQLGFTTAPGDGRTTLYAGDLAKGFEMPIVHVNADDPEACIEAARLAFAYRARFRRDFLIDLVGYRRYGHNEGDEPTFTQPVLYRKIEAHPTVRGLWGTTLIDRGLIDEDRPESLVRRHMETLQRVLGSLEPEAVVVDSPPEPPPPGAARRAQTAVPAERLRALNDALLRVPQGFTLHTKIERAMQKRRQALTDLDARTIDWATAEALALASVLEDGIAIRLTGQDVARGTFSQRHAVFHDSATGETFVPLQSLPQAQAAFEVHDSPLSENAAVGFEYGYNVQEPGRLVIWEAQYGDFINGAQVTVDEFIASARAKWGQTPSLVLLLPHGYEGQGPDHSSGRLERFLQLSATNLRVANCATAAQYFHLLRRQAALLETDPLPLIVMTPKGLLRHQDAASALRDLTEGRWHPVIDDAMTSQHPDQVRRIVLCSGKVYVDLMASKDRNGKPQIAILRIEQLHPFPIEDLEPIIGGYPGIEEILWVQEEPENMGAWAHARPSLLHLSGGRWPVNYVGRPRNASPAEGSTALHARNQAALVAAAFDLKLPLRTADIVPLTERS